MATARGYGEGSFTDVANQLERAAFNLGAVTSATVAFSRSINSFRVLQQQLVLTNTVAQGTAKQFKDMERSVREFALSSKTTANEAAGALYELASAGFDVTESMAAMAPVINLATATLEPVPEVADLVANSIRAFGYEARDAARLANVFAASIATSQATLPKLAFALRQVAPVAGAVGLSVEQTTAYLNILFNAGLRGEQAGTALRNVIVRLAKPVGDAAKLLQQFNIQLNNPETGKLRDVRDILTDIANARLSEGDLARISETEALAGFITLLKNINGEYDKQIEKISDTQEAYRQAQEQLKTLDGAIKLANNSLNELALNLGQTTAPAFMQVSYALNDLVKQWFDLDEGTKAYYLTYVLLAGAVVASLATFKILAAVLGGLIAPLRTVLTLVGAGGLLTAFLALGPVVAGTIAAMAAIPLALNAPAVLRFFGDVVDAADRYVRQLSGVLSDGRVVDSVSKVGDDLARELENINRTFAKSGFGLIDKSQAVASVIQRGQEAVAKDGTFDLESTAIEKEILYYKKLSLQYSSVVDELKGLRSELEGVFGSKTLYVLVDSSLKSALDALNNQGTSISDASDILAKNVIELTKLVNKDQEYITRLTEFFASEEGKSILNTTIKNLRSEGRQTSTSDVFKALVANLDAENKDLLIDAEIYEKKLVESGKQADSTKRTIRKAKELNKESFIQFALDLQSSDALLSQIIKKDIEGLRTTDPGVAKELEDLIRVKLFANVDVLKQMQTAFVEGNLTVEKAIEGLQNFVKGGASKKSAEKLKEFLDTVLARAFLRSEDVRAYEQLARDAQEQQARAVLGVQTDVISKYENNLRLIDLEFKNGIEAAQKRAADQLQQDSNLQNVADIIATKFPGIKDILSGQAFTEILAVEAGKAVYGEEISPDDPRWAAAAKRTASLMLLANGINEKRLPEETIRQFKSIISAVSDLLSAPHILQEASLQQNNDTLSSELQTLASRRASTMADLFREEQEGYLAILDTFEASDFAARFAQKSAAIDAKYNAELVKAQNERDEALLEQNGLSASEIESIFSRRFAIINNARNVELEEARRSNEDLILGYKNLTAEFSQSLQDIREQSEDAIFGFFGGESSGRVATLRSRDLFNAYLEQQQALLDAEKKRNDLSRSTAQGDTYQQQRIQEGYEEEVRLINELYDAQVKYYNSTVATYEYTQAAIRQNIDLMKRQAAASNDFFEGFNAAAYEAANELNTIFANLGEETFDKMATSLSSAFADAFVGIQVSWKDTLKNMALDIIRSGIQDVMKGVIGSALTVFTNPSQAKAAGGKGIGIGDISGVGSLLQAGSGLSTLLSGTTGGFSTLNLLGAKYLGTGLPGLGGAAGATTAGVTGATLSGVLSGAGIGSLIAGFAGLGSGNFALDTGLSLGGAYGGSALASALGFSSLAGPAGIAGAIALQALGGLFKKKPSSKLQSGTFDLGLGDFVGRGGLTGGKFSQENADAVSNLGQISGALGKLFGVVGDLQIAVGGRSGLEYAFTNNANIFDNDSEIRKQFNTANEFVKSLTQDFAEKAGESLNQYVEIALKNIDFGADEEGLKRALADLEFAFNFDKIGDAPEKISAVKQALDEVKARFDVIRVTAERLGLPLEKVAEGLKKAEDAIRKDFLKGITDDFLSEFNPALLQINQLTETYIQNLKDAQLLGIDTTLIDITYRERLRRIMFENNKDEQDRLQTIKDQAKEAEKLMGTWQNIADDLRDTINGLLISDLSTLSPLQKLQEAQNQFDTLFADRSNPESAAKLDEAAKSLLELGKDYFATSTDYADIFMGVQESLEDAQRYAADQVDVQQALLNAANQQIDVLEKGFGDLADLLARLSPDEQAKVLGALGTSVDPYTGKATNAAGRSLAAASGAYNLTVGQVESIYRNALGYTGASGSGQLEALAQAASQQVKDQINAAVKKAAGIPGFAGGGSTPANGFFTVGERGPELGSFDRTMKITPIANAEDMVKELKEYRRQSAKETMDLGNRVDSLGEALSTLSRKLDRLTAQPGR